MFIADIFSEQNILVRFFRGELFSIPQCPNNIMSYICPDSGDFQKLCSRLHFETVYLGWFGAIQVLRNVFCLKIEPPPTH